HIETLWDYMQLKQDLKPADCLFVMCSNDVRVAEHAAALYHQKLAPLIVFSGGEGRFTDGLFEKSEAETFADIARLAGVPSDAILVETRSTNSGENVRFTEQLLKEKGVTLVDIDDFIDVVKQLLANHAPEPSLLHGDLWNGNAALTACGPICYDPACYWGDRECDIAMTEL
ncbi:fructosamine kinase family protein, partial [Vibrio sp. 1262-1]|uniref:fructosamine kinase family protein n=1 Tax=Vibrio sp. 1262-1 TaxID=3074548 RepID=UPI0029655CEF